MSLDVGPVALAAKIRQFLVGVEQQGLRPHSFRILARELGDEPLAPTTSAPVRVQQCGPQTLAQWRADRQGLSTAFFRDRIDRADRCTLAIDEDGVAGVAWIYRARRPSRMFRLGEGKTEINHVFVLPAHRGRGIMKILLTSACAWRRAEGYHTVYAAVHSDNAPSLAGFHACGFCELVTLRHFLLFRPRFHGCPAAAGVP